MCNEFLRGQFELLDRFLEERPGQVWDLAAGLGVHARRLLESEVQVVAVDRVLTPELDAALAPHPGRARFIRADITRLPVESDRVPSIWACHCLEHVEAPVATLREWRRVLKPQGLLAVVVPPYKSEIVGRHVISGWNVGQLMLTLLRAGYRIRDGVFARLGLNVLGIVRKADAPLELQPNDEILFQYHAHFPPDIDCEILQKRFTNSFGETVGRFEGEIDRLGW